MAAKALPCPTLLRLLLDYDPETGKLYWKPRKPWMFTEGGRFSIEGKANQFNQRFAHTEAFTCRNRKGYATGAIKNRGLLAHRVIWAMTFGMWPENLIDHINHKTDDNRLVNLREATPSQNMQHRRANRTSKYSRFKGVCKAKKTGLWTSAISVDGKQTHLGSFRSEEDAARAYDAVARRLHGEYAVTNF